MIWVQEKAIMVQCLVDLISAALSTAGSFAREQLVTEPSSKAASDQNFNSMKFLLDVSHYANFSINTAANNW